MAGVNAPAAPQSSAQHSSRGSTTPTSQDPPPLAEGGPWLVVCDVDSTFLRDEVIELFARHAGVEAEVAAVTEAAMRGELDFAESLRARVALLKDLPIEVAEHVRAGVRLTPGAAQFARALHAGGHTLALVSGGFAEVVEPLARELGIGHVTANRFEVVDGTLTGRVSGRIVDRGVKADTLRDLATSLGIPRERTAAVGDGANDLDMLAAAGTAIAFTAKPIVREAADVVIDAPDLLLVLDALGLPREP